MASLDHNELILKSHGDILVLGRQHETAIKAFVGSILSRDNRLSKQHSQTTQLLDAPVLVIYPKTCAHSFLVACIIVVTSQVKVVSGRVAHYGDVIMCRMASQITSLTIVYSPFIQSQIKENIKAPRLWSLWGEFTDDRWIPRKKGQ